MASYIGIGFSENPNIKTAATEAANSAKEQIQNIGCDLAIVFTSIEYASKDCVETINAILEPKNLVGCTTAGIILPESIQENGIGVLAIASNDIIFGTSAVNVVGDQDLHQAGFELGRSTTANFPQGQRHAFITLSDGQFKNNSRFVKGIQEVLGNASPVIGGVSCDNFKYSQTYQFYNNRMMTSSATGLLIGGHANLAIGCEHGWQALGKPRIIDRAEENVIHTIDGQPAINIYREFFGEEAESIGDAQLSSISILYPLGVYLEEEGKYILRNAVGLTHNGGIICQGEVPQNAEVHIMIGNKEACKDATLKAAKTVRDNLQGKQPQLILVFESMTRYKILGRTAIQQLNIIKEFLGYTTPLFGMYSYGEIAPFKSLQNVTNTHLQNESILLIAIS